MSRQLFIVDKDGYILEYSPNHPFKDANERVRKHRLVYERYYNVCLLPWTVIHHLNDVKDDNRIENLEALSPSEHALYHMTVGGCSRLGKHKDTSYIECFKCGSDKTYIRHPKGMLKTSMPLWRHLPEDKLNWYCHKCYMKITQKHRYWKAILSSPHQ